MTASGDEFRVVPGYEGLYEITQDGRLFAIERVMIQRDSIGRTFRRMVKRHEKSRTVNSKGYPSFNLHKNNRQTCRLVSTLLRDAWGIEVPALPSP